MKRLALSLMLVSFGLFQAAPAFAGQVDLRISAPKLQAVCTNVGGDFRTSKSGAYGCQNDCGMGDCVITCDADRNCLAEAPGILVADMNVRHILLNLYNPSTDGKGVAGHDYAMTPWGLWQEN